MNHIHPNPPIAILILAAGSSSRLGQPKQLLLNNGNSFIKSLSMEALKVSPLVYTVFGHNSPLIQKEIENEPVRIVINPEWAEGMASSIRKGLEKILEQEPNTSQLLLLVCDQPFVNSALLEKMMEKHRESAKPIVACAYKGTLGTPVLFSSSFFPELLSLKGTTGAKKIVAAHPEETASIPFPLGFLDIDTPMDMETFQKIQEANP